MCGNSKSVRVYILTHQREMVTFRLLSGIHKLCVCVCVGVCLVSRWVTMAVRVWRL